MKPRLFTFLVFLFSFGMLISMLKISSSSFTLPDKKESYQKLWLKVDSCERKGLTESALKVVEVIYTKSVEEKKSDQLIKAIIYRMKLESQKEEFSLEKNIATLGKETEKAEQPAKQILHSILADAYWQYYSNNRWKFSERSATTEFNNEDVSTWDLKLIVDATIKNYKASLNNTALLKQTPVGNFEEILTKGSTDTRAWRSTLYDFLGHRAIDFLVNTEPDVTRPANRFTVNDPVFLKTYTDFSKVELINPSDSLETKYFGLKIMQDITRFHMERNEMDALLDVELKRLDYIQAHSNHAKKDTLYLETLNTLKSKFASNKRLPEIDYRIANWYQKESSKYKPLGGDAYKWYKRHAIEICDKVIQGQPESYGAKQCQNLKSSIETRQMNLTLEEVNAPNKPYRALVSSANINKVHFKIVRTSHNELKRIYNKYWGEKLYNRFLEMPVAASFTRTVENDGDYQLHHQEILMPELPYGYYVVLASVEPDFKFGNNLVAYAQCIVSDITTIERNNNGNYEFYALHRQSGEPLKDISVQVWHYRYNYTSRDYEYRKGEVLRTDERGFFTVKNTKDEERNFNIELINGKDTYFNNNSYYVYKPYEDNNTHVRTHIFTDRAIYRPGQTVYFKTLALEGKNKEEPKLKTNYPLTVTFYDVNHQKISSLDVTTNEYGTASGSFIAPQGVLNGQMYISDGYGQTYFSVEEYKRPKFEATMDPVQGTYRLNDTVMITGKAKAYAGNYIDGAAVNYRVVRKVRYPYWYWWYRGYYGNGNEETEILNGSATTNDTGAFIIRFKALPDESVSKNSQADFVYEIMADITDLNGETHSTQSMVTIGYKALNLDISTPEVQDISQLKPLKFITSNLNGVPESSKINYTIYKLRQPSKTFRERLWSQPDRHSISKAEYYNTFPNDLYADELNKYKWEKESKVTNGIFDNSKSTELDLMKDASTFQPGVYMVEGICKDKFGVEVKSYAYFTVFKEGSDQLPEQNPDWFYSNTAQAEPGETVKYIQASGYGKVTYLFETESKGILVNSMDHICGMNKQEIKIEEKDRGNLSYHITFVKNNRLYHHSHVITVPYTNKELDFGFETFRNKLLPGQKEEWRIVIKDKKGDKMAAELLAGMYDASLDAFRANSWYMNIYQTYYSSLQWGSGIGNSTNSTEFSNYKYQYAYLYPRSYDHLNYFGLHFYSYRRYGYYADEVMAGAPVMKSAEAAAPMEESKAESETRNTKKRADKNMAGENLQDIADGDAAGAKATGQTGGKDKEADNRNEGKAGSEVKVRSNFNETAFFYPHLSTNEKGETIISFTVPESLTKWKVMGLAHTKDLKYGTFEQTVITQKDLMVQPSMPRFFREGDKMALIAKVVNLTDKEMKGRTELKFYDALTDQDVTSKILLSTTPEKEFTSGKGKSAAIEWTIQIPDDVKALKYRLTAQSGTFSDGEEMAIPVLTNRMLVTESMPLPVRGNTSKDFVFTKFKSRNNNSTTLRDHSYTLEFTSNPAWYAVQSLPYIMEYPYECAEQTFSRYYANALAGYIVNSKPKIKQVFEQWKNSSPATFLSNLEKNQELKAVLLEETPWVLQAKNESENKKRVGLLFDLNRMNNEQGRALRKLFKAQTSNGGFWWFEGGPDDRYITQHIACGFGHLDNLKVLKTREEHQIWQMLEKAVRYCDDRLKEDLDWIKRYDKDYKTKNHLGYNAVHYLYMRSFYKDIPVEHRNKEAVDYFTKQAQTYWLDMGRYSQAMIALSLHRDKDLKTPKDIMKSLKENSLNNDEMGMYWKENYGYYWYQAPIEQQALMIEAFDEILNDAKSVDDLKTWLIKSKQTQHWGTTRATTEAVYALLLKGQDWLETEPTVEIQIGKHKLNPKTDKDLQVEPGTGYFKKTWHKGEIEPDMGDVKVVKKGPGVSWGAVYWQYFEQLDKITPHETPLKLKKQLFVQRNTASGPVIESINENTKLKPGDKIKVRIELRVDRDMDYVHMKDMRAAGFEPVNVFSGYKWQDGLGYYESTRDAATNFFFPHLHKGTFVFEYPLFVNHKGDFSNGITQIQCMYAPEFTSHSEGVRVKVGN